MDEKGPLGLALTVAFVAPLQGFSNFLVYVRPKLLQRGRRTSDKRTSPSKVSLAAMMRNVMPNRMSDTFRHRSSDGSFTDRAMDPSVAIALPTVTKEARSGAERGDHVADFDSFAFEGDTNQLDEATTTKLPAVMDDSSTTNGLPCDPSTGIECGNHEGTIEGQMAECEGAMNNNLITGSEISEIENDDEIADRLAEPFRDEEAAVQHCLKPKDEVLETWEKDDTAYGSK